MAAPALAQETAANAAATGADEIIVTAQKRSERLQDVPIAVSAFSENSLKTRGLLGGSDLQQAIPNVSFTSTGFNRSNFQIRGIGAQIQGFSVDTGVGVHQNNAPLTSSRLAEAEFYDVERIEVLRGPQGTLYGRNATGGVLNIITAKPRNEFAGEVTGELGNFDTLRLKGFINVPVGDTLAVRAAGTLIKRDGIIDNLGTGNDIEDRDLWSTRLSVGWTPSDRVKAYVMWEHFSEDDSRGLDRAACAPRAAPTSVGGIATNPFTAEFINSGCQANRIEDPSNNGTISSLATLPGLFGLLVGVQPNNAYLGAKVGTNLRQISSGLDPAYRAKSDTIIGQLEFAVTDALTLTSLTSYNKDFFRAFTPIYSSTPTSGFLVTPLTPTGVINDPQLGASDRIQAAYLSRQSSRQYSQELRLQSAFTGPFNFSIGGIYVDYKQDSEVIALANTVTLLAVAQNFGGAGIYIDPNQDPDGTGHNYYNNFGPYRLKSAAAFGEGYWQATDTLKFTVGLRYTNDLKRQTTYPVLLLAPGSGFPPVTPEKVRFTELTGRFTADWKPEIAFTDDSLFYASYSRGYKGGGFNPGSGAIAGVRRTFDPEFVNAFEIGTKNSLLDRKLTLNMTGFYYDYKGYQVARLANQTVNNENIDATIKGLEFEATFAPVKPLRFNAAIGFLDSKIKNSSSIDVLDRTQGDTSLTVVRSVDPAAGFAAQCAVPTALVAQTQAAINAGLAPPIAIGFLCGNPLASAGHEVNLNGKRLPNAAKWTINLGAEFEMNMTSDISGLLRVDYFRQSQTFGRIYNSVADRIPAWDSINMSYKLSSVAMDLDVMVYARNLLSKNAIVSYAVTDESVGAVRRFRTKEPAMYGVSITKRF